MTHLPAKGRFDNFRVLLVEDQAFIRQIVKGMVRTLGFGEIDEAADGAAALTLLKRHPPDLVICDVAMEPMNGLDLLRSLRQSDSARLRRLPFIMLTSHGEEALVEQAVRDGADAYVLKPVSQAALESRILFVLKGVLAKE